ncbi:MAG: hypothetical protein FJW68_08450 [Actinobacteria bacterium]|nr:hypothetical protein [Actinomycetota bacterium]
MQFKLGISGKLSRRAMHVFLLSVSIVPNIGGLTRAPQIAALIISATLRKPIFLFSEMLRSAVSISWCEKSSIFF